MLIVHSHLASDIEHINFDNGEEFVIEKFNEFYLNYLDKGQIKYLIYNIVIYKYLDFLKTLIQKENERIFNFIKKDEGLNILLHQYDIYEEFTEIIEHS